MRKFKPLLYWVIMGICFWVMGVQWTDNLLHPELTRMQVFLRLPQTFFLDFTP